ncbi:MULTISPECIES: FtsX-like permease family protein [unclassified Streptomyces]|uniref:FtsX-like permease family protein n=1 Tax=unclassified Streptomyces TaxID=2593676 RepID=UPI000DBA9C13|nr:MULTISPECIES: FtsX-like permease family protein [unclassified Streptomyces]MYT71227.1 ABC transporter permease [Streptomyces sp. SID8367]RAJ72494.1 FtsX-like permease family protein [Streptomyces sp. PsTaAH-137]
MLAWGVRRVLAHRLPVLAAVLAVTLAATVLTALAAFSTAAGDVALRRTLSASDHRDDTALTVTADVPDGGRSAARATVARQARSAFAGLPVTVRESERSVTYGLPGGDRDHPDLARLATLDTGRVRLVSGRLPSSVPSGSVPVAVPRIAADRLKVRAGDTLALTGRLDSRTLRVTVTGVYEARDTADPYWRLDPLGGRGAATVSFTTYGPLLAPAAAFTTGRVTTDSTAWSVTADTRGLTVADADDLRDRVVSARAALRKAPALGGAAEVTTGLPALLDQAATARSVAATSLLTAAVHLVVLALGVLLLVARLLRERRTAETALLRARGASTRRLSAVAGVEALCLALPAAAVAVLAARPLAGLFAADAAHAPLTAPVVLLALLTALAGAAVVLGTATPARDESASGRVRALPGPVRAGADVALAVLAAAAWLPLRSGDRLTPVAAFAPALTLLAGTVLLLRLLPWAARAAELLAARRRGAGAALAGRQFARRPAAATAPVLLLALAVATGLLATGQNASWRTSQYDQADQTAGAPLRLDDPRPSGPGQSGRVDGVRDLRAVAPVHRADTDLSGGARATVLAADTGALRSTVLSGPALADGALAPLAAARPSAEGPRVTLPKDAQALLIRARTGPRDRGVPAARVTVLVTDRHGTAYRLPAGELPADGRTHRLRAALDTTADAARFAPAGPLTVVEIGVEGSVPARAGTADLRIDALSTEGDGAGSRALALPAGLTWSAESTVTRGTLDDPARTLRPRAAGDGVALSYPTGSDDIGDATSTVRLRPGAVPRASAALPALATDAYLRATGAHAGDTVDVTVSGETLRVRIAATAPTFPTTGTDGALVVDLAAAEVWLAAHDRDPLAPTEWWAAPEAGRTVQAAAHLRAAVPGATVTVRDEVAARLLGDPLSGGVRGALWATAAAAVVLAALGLAAAGAGTVRVRRPEFAVLNALGAPRRLPLLLVAAENTAHLLTGLVTGTVIGVLLVHAVVPYTVRTATGARPVPTAVTDLPVTHVLLLLAAVATVPVVVTALLARHAARTPAGAGTEPA